MADPLVLCENLVKIYKADGPEVVALLGLNLDIMPGEMVAIMGASGSGKSTLLNVLGGLDNPSAGRCTVAGRDVMKMSQAQRLHYRRQVIGHVWQQSARNLVPHYTLAQNMDIPQLARGIAMRVRQRRAQELLAAVGLAGMEQKYPNQLSGGQQQRAAIAVAIAHRPPVLLADEPTGELDSLTTQEILRLFRALQATSELTILLATHDAAVAASADRVVGLRDGRTSTETRRRLDPSPPLVADERLTLSGLPANEHQDLLVVDRVGRLQLPRDVEVKARRGGERWVHLSAVFIVGWRQMRDVWRTLLIAGTGMLLAVMLAILLPCYAYLTLDARLHTILESTQQAITISVDLPAALLGSGRDGIAYATRDQELRSLVQYQLGAYLQPQSWHALQTAAFDLHSEDAFGAPQHLIMVATTPADLGSLPDFEQGRMPQDVPVSATPTAAPLLEGALPVDAAAALHVTVGSILNIPYQAGVGFGPLAQQPPAALPLMQVRITGLFNAPVPSTTPFFHVYDFKTFRSGGSPTPVTYSLLVPQQSFLAAADAVGFDQLPTPISLSWFYQPNVRIFTLDNVGDVANRLATVNGTINQVMASSADYLFVVSSPLIGSNSAFQIYQAQVAVASLPIAILLIDIGGLLIFFVSLIAEQLIDSQFGIIALFRARGLSRVQLFGAYLLQSLSLAAGTLLLGLVGAYAVEHLLIPRLVSSGSYHPDITLEQGIGRWLLFALIVAGAALVTMWLTTAIALQGDVLAARREAGRPTRRPIWQRLHLDLALVLVLLAAYGLASYALATVTDPQSGAQLTPLFLVAPTLLVVAGVLALLRVLPGLFRLGAHVMARSRRLLPFLPLVQLARTPQYILRMVLLFALIVAFAVYVFIYSASQESHVADVAAQQVGADITGLIPTNLATTSQDEQQRYQAISGVASASLGYGDEGTPAGAPAGTLVSVLAMDTDTYRRTAIWAGQSGDTTAALLDTLAANRGPALTGDYVPAVVNASAWNALHLSRGATFHLVVSPYADSSMRLSVVAEVPSIPSLDPTQPAILVDLQTYGGVRRADTGAALPTPNLVWLRVRNLGSALSQTRAAITTGSTQLENVVDRQRLETALGQDPLASLITTILSIGLVLTLVLTFIANLNAISIYVRGQVVQFALLRALGVGPAQIRNLLLWELGVMQAVALVLGCVFGGILAVTLTPALVFTTTPPDALQTPLAFYQIQTVLPVRIVIPPSVLLVLAALSVITLGTVALSVLWLRRMAISQVLRFDED